MVAVPIWPDVEKERMAFSPLNTTAGSSLPQDKKALKSPRYNNAIKICSLAFVIFNFLLLKNLIHQSFDSPIMV
jgi:hypothetical protein